MNVLPWFAYSVSLLILLHHAKRREAVNRNLCALLSEKWSEIDTSCFNRDPKGCSKRVKRYETKQTGSQYAGENQLKRGVFIMWKCLVFAMCTQQKNSTRATQSREFRKRCDGVKCEKKHLNSERKW